MLCQVLPIRIGAVSKPCTGREGWQRWLGVPGGGGGGALTLVLGTHCKTDSRGCGCRLEKGGLSRTQEPSGGGLSEGHFLLGL